MQEVCYSMFRLRTDGLRTRDGLRSVCVRVKYRSFQWRTEGVFNPLTPEIPKALQNSAKLNPILKTVKNR